MDGIAANYDPATYNLTKMILVLLRRKKKKICIAENYLIYSSKKSHKRLQKLQIIREISINLAKYPNP